MLDLFLKKEKTKQDSEWLLKSHDKIKSEEMIKALSDAIGELWLKMEPFILHIACRTNEKADELIKKTNTTGLKKSGAISLSNKIIVRLTGNEFLEAPVTKETDKSYIKMLVEELAAAFRIT